MIKTRLEPGDYGAWRCFFEPDSVVRELSLGGQEPVSDDSTFSMVMSTGATWYPEHPYGYIIMDQATTDKFKY